MNQQLIWYTAVQFIHGYSPSLNCQIEKVAAYWSIQGAGPELVPLNVDNTTYNAVVFKSSIESMYLVYMKPLEMVLQIEHLKSM